MSIGSLTPPFEVENRIAWWPKADFMYLMSRNPKFPKGKRAASQRSRSNKRKAKRRKA